MLPRFLSLGVGLYFHFLTLLSIQDEKRRRSTGLTLTFLFQDERLKTSTGGYSCSQVSRQEAKKVPRTFLLPKVIKYGDG